MSSGSDGSIPALDLKTRLEGPETDRPLILDVRAPDEYADWRINESVNIPIDTLNQKENLDRLPKDKEIIAICSHGTRSQYAAEYLRHMGFNARNLQAGLVGWSRLHDVAPVNVDNSPDLSILQIRRVGKGCVSYMIGSKGECVVIDPTTYIEEYLAIASDRRWSVTQVLDTHMHADHISGARALSEETGAALSLNPSDGYRFSGFNHLNDNQAITAGNAHINAIHTPGHTDGSTSFLIEGRWLLTGDTLFLDGIGRPDLREMGEQFAGNLYETYQKKILNLDGGVRVLPGHFSQQLNYEFGRPATATLTELRRSIPMITLGKDEFTRYLLANIPAKPPNHRAILSINRGDVPYDSHRHQVLEEGPNRCSIPVT